MALKDKLAADLRDAMRAGDRTRLDALRMLRAAIQTHEVARTDPKNHRHGEPVSETDLLGVVEKEIKQRQDSIEQFRKGKREDLAAKEQAEFDVLRSYLPAQLTREEIADQVRRLIESRGRDFRAIMLLAARELKGRADGRLVNEVVKELTG